MAKLVEASVDAWQMHGVNTPVFAEYLTICDKAGLGKLVDVSPKDIGENDALIIVDMQNDFIPKDEVNSHGRLSSTEGGVISQLIVDMAEHFAAKGGLVVATRDYHPVDHCSFIPQGGGCPPHCIQGHKGSRFYEPIREVLARLMQDDKRVEIVFKGFHEDVESFGSLPYKEVPPADRGVEFTMNKDSQRLYGCSSLKDWTGSFCLKCSKMKFEDKIDVNAPPDVMAAHARVSLTEVMSGIKRVFVCGLVFDLCVADTALNAVVAGFPESYIVMDATRAIHVPGLGTIGTGFTNEVGLLVKRFQDKNVRISPAVSVLHGLKVVNPNADAKIQDQLFPDHFGPFMLVQFTADITFGGGDIPTWKCNEKIGKGVKEDGTPKIQRSKSGLHGQMYGTCGPKVMITLSAESKKEVGIPETATKFVWANPVANAHVNANAAAWFPELSTSSLFCMYGGFIYLGDNDEVVGQFTVAPGTGLSFGRPVAWKSAFSKALDGRWSPVTIPFLKGKGVKVFAWINPGEELKSAGGETWQVPAEHGAFVFLFHELSEPDDPRDVFFPVVDLKLEPHEDEASPKSTAIPGSQFSYGQQVLYFSDRLQRNFSSTVIGPAADGGVVVSIEGNQRTVPKEKVASHLKDA